MTNFEINTDNLSVLELDQLYTLIEKANKPKSKVWKPKVGEEYWVLNSTGYCALIKCGDSSYDMSTYSIGNCFPSKEEAVEAKQTLKYRAMLKRFSIESGEEDNPWDGEHEHWYICYNTNTKKFYVDCFLNNVYFSIHFASKESALDALATIGEENYKRFILGIKE